MKAKDLAALLLQVPDAEVVMQSLEDSAAGLVPVAIVYDTHQVEIVEDMDATEERSNRCLEGEHSHCSGIFKTADEDNLDITGRCKCACHSASCSTKEGR